jgi:hypothetical protein
MIRTPRFALNQVDAGFSGATSILSRFFLVFLAGSLGNLLGYLCAYRALPGDGEDGSETIFSLLAYPMTLVANLFEPFGIAVTFIFIALLIGVCFFDVSLYHAYGIILPLQAILSLSGGRGDSPISIILLALALPVLATVYIGLLWHRHRSRNA